MTEPIQNPLDKFASSSSDEDIESLLRGYAANRYFPFNISHCDSYEGYFMGNLNAASPETIGRFMGAASRMADGYLDEDPINGHLVGGILRLFNEHLTIDRKKLITAIGKTEKGTMYGLGWGDKKEDLYRSLMFELAFNQEGCDEGEREYLMSFWEREIQDPEYASAAFSGIIELDESRLPAAYEMLKASGIKSTFGVDVVIRYDGLDTKYGITLATPDLK